MNSCTQSGTIQWMSPELLDPEIQGHRQTECSDCYALGMVIYEVLSGHVPFPRCNNYVATMKVLRGERPEKPQGMGGNWLMGAGGVWEVLERCWMPQPRDRPNIEDVLQCLEGVSKSWIPPSPSLEVPSAADSLAHGFSDATTLESTDGSGVSSSLSVAPSRPSEKPNLEESAGIDNGVG